MLGPEMASAGLDALPGTVGQEIDQNLDITIRLTSSIILGRSINAQLWLQLSQRIVNRELDHDGPRPVLGAYGSA